MPLQSKLLAGNPRLEGCLVRDSDHVTPGSQGRFVRLIQAAVIAIDEVDIVEKELEEETYGASTADAILQFKKKRDIINRTYQTTADSIVGKMTIAALDKELRDLEGKTQEAAPPRQGAGSRAADAAGADSPRVYPHRSGACARRAIVDQPEILTAKFRSDRTRA